MHPLQSCECDKVAHFVTSADGSCVKCDDTNTFTLGFYNDRCHCIANAVYNEEEGSCACDDGYVQNGTRCDLGDTTICPNGQILNDEGACVCPENFMQNTESECIQCYGVSAFVDETQCDCGPLALFDPFEYGKCICQDDPEIFAFFGADSSRCVECRGANFEFNSETGECIDISEQFADLS